MVSYKMRHEEGYSREKLLRALVRKSLLLIALERTLRDLGLIPISAIISTWTTTALGACHHLRHQKKSLWEWNFLSFHSYSVTYWKELMVSILLPSRQISISLYSPYIRHPLVSRGWAVEIHMTELMFGQPYIFISGYLNLGAKINIEVLK